MSILDIDEEGCFYIRGNNSCFNRITNLIDLIKKMDDDEEGED